MAGFDDRDRRGGGSAGGGGGGGGPRAGGPRPPRPSAGGRDGASETPRHERGPHPTGPRLDRGPRPEGPGARLATGPRKPALAPQGTTLWDYPSQHYGEGLQGDPRYVGATPSYVIWNLLQRYTRPGDLVVDPMCGSGTTLDVCRDLDRRGRGFDVAPYRPDIERADARRLPLAAGSVDFVFVDPPYSTNVNYSDDPRCIGKLDAFEEGYFEALDQVFRDCHRVLANRRMMAVYVCDVQQKRRGFAPIGVRLFALLMQYFQPVDHIAVVRHNRTLNDKRYQRQAQDDNTFLRGFNHLIVVKKHDPEG